LTPLAIVVSTSAIILPLNDSFGFLSSAQLAVGYLSGIFMASFYGSRRAISYERTLSPNVIEILENGGATSAVVQESYSYLIYDAKDVKTAAALLSNDKLVSEKAQEILAEVVCKHGTKEQAKDLLKSAHLCPLAQTLLRLKAE
jgi:hypothetical protein